MTGKPTKTSAELVHWPGDSNGTFLKTDDPIAIVASCAIRFVVGPSMPALNDVDTRLFSKRPSRAA
jgi:hypothetical protein